MKNMLLIFYDDVLVFRKHILLFKGKRTFWLSARKTSLFFYEKASFWWSVKRRMSDPKLKQAFFSCMTRDCLLGEEWLLLLCKKIYISSVFLRENYLQIFFGMNTSLSPIKIIMLGQDLRVLFNRKTISVIMRRRFF